MFYFVFLFLLASPSLGQRLFPHSQQFWWWYQSPVIITVMDMASRPDQLWEVLPGRQWLVQGSARDPSRANHSSSIGLLCGCSAVKMYFSGRWQQFPLLEGNHLCKIRARGKSQVEKRKVKGWETEENIPEDIYLSPWIYL